jgi:uncharacterized membrane-anchored protein YitT (DUF2179 family)
MPLHKINTTRTFKDIILITSGILSAVLGLKGFLLPNKFIDGGVTGISLLLSEFTNVPLSLLIFICNLPFIYLGFSQISKIFALKTFMGITGLAICLALIQFPILTKDKLLISVFGGFFLGAGIGLSIRGGSVIDGTEILALTLSRKTSRTIGDIILIINIVIFGFAALLLGIESALYSILTYLAASKTADFIIHGIEEYTGITIISDKSEEIRLAIINQLGRGVTIYKGKTGMDRRDIDILYTVVTRLETNKLKNEIDKIDANAFVIEDAVNDTKGGMIKKKPLHQ